MGGCIMSMESAKAFIEKMKTDEDFRNKVNEYKDNENRKAFLMKEGFTFTEKDIKALKTELTEDELQRISAGTTGYCFLLNTGHHPW